MEAKEAFYQLLHTNNGQLNESDLGEQMGLTEDETQQIISTLLSENKIEFKNNRSCSYSVLKANRKK
ncbi:hypothetical protein [Phaeocystidibacter marisrubri]|uniref:MarR family transcriptional regulator n=1 Tax=Phaeocystidibacter marisrubri TaxID=1577780 RepID=A0A6L3ZEM9_9FLAO|nr:hypothetical protein [Phaeocystidibacter marisrubri]KAB2815140.1 hypothetical protein F8C82_13660 [Phaeocystidibacter marisrubri]GGH70540.1 hypothetical protein GCM10011318_12640 [Phaeocystidibacter marisrubri]